MRSSVFPFSKAGNDITPRFRSVAIITPSLSAARKKSWIAVRKLQRPPRFSSRIGQPKKSSTGMGMHSSNLR